MFRFTNFLKICKEKLLDQHGYWANQRADLRIEEIYRAIYKYGYLMRWERASKCPCLDVVSGQPDRNCTLCLGKGRFWSDPQMVRGIMTSFSDKMMFNQTGEIISGVSYFTTLPNYKMSNWDRVSNLHSQIRYSEVVMHETYGATDKLKFKPLGVFILRTVSTVYTNKQDFIFDTNAGVINWLPTGHEPPAGEKYTVEYLMHPSWIVIDATNIIRDTMVKTKNPALSFQELPQRVTVRLEYFVL